MAMMMLYLDPNYGDTPWLGAPSHWCGVAGSILHISLLPGETGESVGSWPTSGPCPPILMELCVWKIGIVESVTVRSLSHLWHIPRWDIFSCQIIVTGWHCDRSDRVPPLQVISDCHCTNIRQEILRKLQKYSSTTVCTNTLCPSSQG